MGSLGSAAARQYDFGGIAEDVYIANVGHLQLNNGANTANNNTFLDSGTGNGGSPFTVTRTGTSIGQGRLSPFAPQGYCWNVQQNNFNIFIGNQIVSPILTIGPTSTFTIEGWMFLAGGMSTTEQMAPMIANNSTAFNSFINWGIGINNRRQATFQWRDVNGIQTYSHPLLTDAQTWVYIQVTANNGALQIAVNGQVARNPIFTRSTLTSPATTVATLQFGTAREYTPGVFIAGLRISNIVRPFVLPNQYYTSDANTLLLCCQSNRFIDLSSNNVQISTNNYPNAPAFVPFNRSNTWTQAANAGSAQFDGTPSTFLSVADNANLELGSGDWCIELWLQINSIAAGAYTLLSKRLDNANVGAFLLDRSGNNLRFYLSSNGTAWNIVNGVTIASLMAPQTWINIAIYRIGNAVYSAVNGVVTNRYSGAAFTVFNTATPNYIGADSNANWWAGLLGPMRWTIGSVPAGFTTTAAPVPTAPYTNDTNTKLLLLFSNGNIFDTQNRTSINTGAGMNLSTAQTRFSTAALNFNNNYGIFGFGPNIALNSSNTGGDFTVEMWVWINNFASGRFIMDIYNNNASTRLGFKTDITTGVLSVFGTGSTSIRSTASGVPAATWLHIAVSRKSNALRFFVNGAQQGTTITNSTQAYVFDSTSAYLGTDGGALGTSNMLGYISNFRITRGIGRYTQNFTIPRGAFPTFTPRT